MGKKATAIKSMSDKFTGTTMLFKVDPPIGYDYDWEDDFKPTKQTEYIVASATVVMFGGGPETYLFAADEEGNILDWSELDGSQKGTLNIDAVMRDAGYELEFSDVATEEGVEG